MAGLYVMHAQDVRPVQQGQRVQYGGAVQGFFRPRAEHFIDHPLSGKAHKHGNAELLDGGKSPQQCVIVVPVLAETEPGVDDNVRYTSLPGRV